MRRHGNYRGQVPGEFKCGQGQKIKHSSDGTPSSNTGIQINIQRQIAKYWKCLHAVHIK